MRVDVEHDVRAIPWSAKALRTTESPISYFMQKAVDNPRILCLDAGLVDAQPLPAAEVPPALPALPGRPDPPRAPPSTAPPRATPPCATSSWPGSPQWTTCRPPSCR